MIEPHYCEEHNTNFRRFEKEGKSWYSHKIDGTDKWHNEPKDDEALEVKQAGENTFRKIESNADSMLKCNAMNNTIALVNGGIIGVGNIKEYYHLILDALTG